MTTINELIVSLEKLSEINVSKPLTKSCILVQETAKDLCPINTGQLYRSIDYTVEGSKGEVGTNVEYAPYVEFGTGLFSSMGDGRQDVPWRYQTPDGKWHTTSGNKPQPFLLPALDVNEDNIIKIFSDAIDKEFK